MANSKSWPQYKRNGVEGAEASRSCEEIVQDKLLVCSNEQDEIQLSGCTVNGNVCKYWATRGLHYKIKIDGVFNYPGSIITAGSPW